MHRQNILIAATEFWTLGLLTFSYKIYGHNPNFRSFGQLGPFEPL